MSVVGPFLVLGTSTLFLALSRDDGGDGTLGSALGLAMILAGVLGVFGDAVETRLGHHRRKVSYRWGVAVAVALGGASYFLVGRDYAGMETAAPAVLLGSVVVVHFAWRHGGSPRGALWGRLAVRSQWLGVVSVTTLYAILLLADPIRWRASPRVVFAVCAAAAALLAAETWLRRRRFRTTLRHAEESAAPKLVEVQSVEELGVGEGWFRLGALRSPYRCPTAGTWLHGDPARVERGLTRFVWCACATLTLAALGMCLPEPVPHPELVQHADPPVVGTPFVPVQGSACSSCCTCRRCPLFDCVKPCGK